MEGEGEVGGIFRCIIRECYRSKITDSVCYGVDDRAKEENGFTLKEALEMVLFLREIWKGIVS